MRNNVREEVDLRSAYEEAINGRVVLVTYKVGLPRLP